MNFIKLFYWLTVADNARLFFQWGAGIFTAIFGLSLIIYCFSVMDDSSDAKAVKDPSRKFLFYSTPFFVFFWLALVLTPSKKDSLLIIAGGGTLNYLSSDSSARQIPKEMTNFVLTELKSMALESQVDLQIQSNKEKVLEEVKALSAEELLGRMKEDTTLVNILLK